MKNLHTKKTSNGGNFGWLIRQMSINGKSGRKTFRRRFVSGSLFVSPCPPECNFQSETKIEPDLRLNGTEFLPERERSHLELPPTRQKAKTKKHMASKTTFTTDDISTRRTAPSLLIAHPRVDDNCRL